MQDRISAPGHTFWLNQELGLKRVAASAAVGKIEFYHIPFKNCKLNCKICTNISFASSPISQTLFLAQFVLALWEEILQFKVHACKSGTNLRLPLKIHSLSLSDIFIPKYSSEEHLYLKNCMVLIGTGVLIFQIFALIGWVMSPNIRSTAEA